MDNQIENYQLALITLISVILITIIWPKLNNKK